MANVLKSVPENVPGDFFVDSTCIDCDACRQLAPTVFAEARDTSYVMAQPRDAEDRRAALRALLCCPTGSIGCTSNDDPKSAISDLPLLVEEPVYYCGFNSPKSYGGDSYLIRHAAGNWLVDSPKFLAPLVRQLERLGGISHIFLTHRDDVADAEKYARHFAARRVIDTRELSSQPDAELVLTGNEPQELAQGILAIPTPGHTQGHCCLLFADKFLFTGDHLSWSRTRRQLSASRDYCWHSWSQQVDSMARLQAFRFQWVLPGHGQSVKLSEESMQQHLRQLVERMHAAVA